MFFSLSLVLRIGSGVVCSINCRVLSFGRGGGGGGLRRVLRDSKNVPSDTQFSLDRKILRQHVELYDCFEF